MPKAYSIWFYRSIKDPDALPAYGTLSGPAIEAPGGKFLARGVRVALPRAAAVTCHDGAAC